MIMEGTVGQQYTESTYGTTKGADYAICTVEEDLIQDDTGGITFLEIAVGGLCSIDLTNAWPTR